MLCASWSEGRAASRAICAALAARRGGRALGTTDGRMEKRAPASRAKAAT